MDKSIFTLCALTALAGLCACQPGKPADIPPDEASSAAAQSVETKAASSQQVNASASSSAVSFSQAEVDAGAAKFVAAIRSRDFAALRAYYPKDYPADELKADAADPTFVRKALLPIVNQGPMAARLAGSYADGTFSILFYQSSVANRIDDKAYLKSSAYLKTFFICNFAVSKGQWQVAQPILCYDETEGPYEDIGSY